MSLKNQNSDGFAAGQAKYGMGLEQPITSLTAVKKKVATVQKFYSVSMNEGVSRYGSTVKNSGWETIEYKGFKIKVSQVKDVTGITWLGYKK